MSNNCFLTEQQIRSLHHTSCPSFFNEQRDRFEVHEASFDPNIKNMAKLKDEDWHFRFYHTRIEALFAYNYFSQETETMLLFDMEENPQYGENRSFVATRERSDS